MPIEAIDTPENRRPLGVTILIGVVWFLAVAVLGRSNPKDSTLIVTEMKIVGVVLFFVGLGLLLGWRWSRWACMIYFAKLGLQMMIFKYHRVFGPGPTISGNNFSHWFTTILVISLTLAPVVYLGVGKKPRAYFRKARIPTDGCPPPKAFDA